MYFWFDFEVKEGEACQRRDHLKDEKGNWILDKNVKSLSQIKNCEGENTVNGLTCVYESYVTSDTDNVLDISAKCIETAKLGKLVIRTRFL